MSYVLGADTLTGNTSGHDCCMSIGHRIDSPLRISLKKTLTCRMKLCNKWHKEVVYMIDRGGLSRRVTRSWRGYSSWMRTFCITTRGVVWTSTHGHISQATTMSGTNTPGCNMMFHVRRKERFALPERLRLRYYACKLRPTHPSNPPQQTLSQSSTHWVAIGCGMS